MKEFFLFRDDQKLGPFSLSDLLEENLESTTLVWRLGFSDWVEAGNVPELQEVLEHSPPKIPSSGFDKSQHNSEFSENVNLADNDEDIDDAVTSEEAKSGEEDSNRESDLWRTESVLINHPWRRLLARSLDILLVAYPAIGIFGFLYGALFEEFSENFLLANFDNFIFTLIFFYLHWIFLEALLVHWFGTTPGKWLFRIRISSGDGGRPNLKQSFKRILNLYAYGEGLGIPLVNIAFRIYSYQELKKKGFSTWDEIARTEVRYKELSLLRKLILVLVCILAAFAFIHFLS